MLCIQFYAAPNLTPPNPTKMTRKRKADPSPVSRRSSLSVGSEVEVRSNEDGFHGSWFEATITKDLAKSRSYAVAYTTLLSSSSSDGEEPPAPLEEAVRSSMVRPRPPRAGPNKAYGLHHLVEAFHNDGWWAGVVSGLPGGGRDLYTVCFPSSREEFKFRTSELREQMQWLRGSWISLQGQQQGGPDEMFGVGAPVEVSRDNQNYGAAWFVGTVLKVIGKKNFLVEYENLRVDGEDGNSGTLLKEIVDLQYIRPPPTSKSKKFNVLDEVEAYCGDGWYAATVLKVLPGPRYVVNSKGGEVELDQSSIRCRCSWTGGVWLHFSQGKQLESQTSRGIKSAGCGRNPNNGKSHPVFELTSSNDSSEVANESNFVMSKRKETGGPDSEIQTESLHAPKKPRNGKLFGQPCQSADEMLRECIFQTEGTSVKSPYSENPLIVAIPALADTQDLQGTPERIPKSHGECTPVGNETADSLVCMDSSFNNNSRVSKCQLNACSSLVPSGLEASDFTPISGWGSCKGLHSSKDNTRMRRKKLAIWRKKPIDVVDARHHEEVETTVRNRDQNQETRIVNMRASIERDGSETRQEEERNEIVSGEGMGDGVGIADRALSGNISPNVVLPRDNVVVECSSAEPPCCQHAEETQSENSLIVINEKTFKADLSKHWTNKQRNFLEDSYLNPIMEPIRLAKLLYSTTQQPHHPVGRLFGNEVKEMQICAFELDRAEREDQALVSSSQEIILLNSNELVPSLLLSDRTVSRDNEETMIGANPSEPSSDKMEPPFTKKSTLWKQIESDDAFRIMPQQPHFRQLEHNVMELREGMAIGLMVAYADLVSEIRAIGVVNSPKIYEDKLKALDSLESNGFNVQFLRDRLRNLLEMKDKLIESERQRVELEGQLVERVAERGRYRILSSALDKVISDWEENLSLLRMKRASIISNMDSNDLEIQNLQRAAQANREAIVSATEQYNDALSAPW
ncbi:DUF724 domain-containing protein 3-like isoform X2 [Iris pallida]|uniref:DUF724 domain-containing protein 3-like isoform X2 n=1 Tax=Iris pallida TaxID=29817 RepID=A0AAX6H9C0_IRIPA|nr:DUF724 domain-containing protein 3-like isoform X2 [Iris pallida]